MTTHTHPSTGDTVHTITGRRQYIGALSLGLAGIETPEDLAALGFAPYTPPPGEPGPTEAQRLATEHPELPGEVRAAFGELGQLVALGVQLDLSGELPGWPAITAAIAAAKAAATTLEQLRDLCAHADAADGHWRAVATWCGDYATAYRLAPELAEIGV